MTIVLQCPRCGQVWRHEPAPDREFVSAYCMCSTASDARASDAHAGVRMVVLESSAREAVAATA